MQSYKDSHYMENNQFDEIDEKILQMLAKDGSIPFQEVARACGVSGTTIHTRVKRLTSLGVIQGSKYIINPAKIGYDTCAYVGLILKDNSQFEHIVAAIKSIPEIVEVHCTNEAYDLFVKIYARNNEHLFTLIQTQLKPLGLSQSRIIISFKVVYNKQLTILPK